MRPDIHNYVCMYDIAERPFLLMIKVNVRTCAYFLHVKTILSVISFINLLQNIVSVVRRTPIDVQVHTRTADFQSLIFFLVILSR